MQVDCENGFSTTNDDSISEIEPLFSNYNIDPNRINEEPILNKTKELCADEEIDFSLSDSSSVFDSSVLNDFETPDETVNNNTLDCTVDCTQNIPITQNSTQELLKDAGYIDKDINYVFSQLNSTGENKYGRSRPTTLLSYFIYFRFICP